MTTKNTDILIAGGGLAGLSLAHQLISASPELDITVVEKRKFPLPRAVAKVGESTVEIGSHYLKESLGLGEHLKDKQLKKFGLRCFFGQPTDDFSQQDELGASQSFGIPTYQLDRGDLENHLATEVQSLGVNLRDGVATESLTLGEGQHSTQLIGDNGPETLSSKWLVDASGRQATVKRKLGLAKPNNHRGNAVWFRINRRIEVDQWTNNDAWQNRCMPTGRRWLSTNHLMGPGYWVWIIPLASGVTSIGIVMDDQAFEQAKLETPEKAVSWLQKNQARLAQAMEGAAFMDYVAVRDYSYSCKQVFSDKGWGLIGEAGVFADPFYSPGSDFIAINNTYLSQLILAQQRGEDIRLNTAVFQKFYFSFYESTLSLYTGQYGGFGDRRMMGLKLLWDYSYYWGVLTLLFFQGTIADFGYMRSMSAVLQKAQNLNNTVQQRFRQRAEKRLVLPTQGVFMDQYKIPCLQHFNHTLMKAKDGEHQQQLSDNVAMLDTIAASIIDMLKDQPSTSISDEERALLGDYRLSIVV